MTKPVAKHAQEQAPKDNMISVRARIQEIHQCPDWSVPSPDGFATLKEEYDYLNALLEEADAAAAEAQPAPEVEPEAADEDGQAEDPTDED